MVLLVFGLTFLGETKIEVIVWIMLAIGACFTVLFYVTKKSDILEPSAKLTKGIDDVQKAASENFAKAKAERVKEAAEAKRFAVRKQAYVATVNARCNSKSIEVSILGGHGWDHLKEKKYLFSMEDSFVCMSDLVSLVDTKIPRYDLRNIDISGPGKVSGNAGITGGGFGLEGAAKGIAAATVINLLTSHSSTKTVIRLGFKDSEIVMLTSQIEPDAARILLSPLYLQLNQKTAPEPNIGLSGELQNLHKLKQDGAITEEEYDKLKRQLIG
jgi:hypothetical protein